MSASPRYLTKSRFKLALECPTKLYYSGKPDYANRTLDNSFLAALADGGQQVGVLAQRMYPSGVLVDETGHAAQVERTRLLLERDEVTIFEAAFEAQGLFVRVDILRKHGAVIELIEVKAKSYHPAKGIGQGFLPYLQDIAFQRFVASRARPAFDYRCFLMLADTSRAASVDGLHQRFAIRRESGRTVVDVAAGTDAGALGDPILTAVPVDAQVEEILQGDLVIGSRRLAFADAVDELARHYRDDRRIDPSPGARCGRCEFSTARPPAPGEARSGFHECWSSAFGWQDGDFDGGTVLDLWNSRQKDKLIARGVLKLSQVSEADLGLPARPAIHAGMTVLDRQWLQVSGRWPGAGAFHLDREGLLAASRGWRYPLHFIDFETSSVPIPFSHGRRPYETTAFQFSHHVLQADGRLAHQTQFLDATPGKNPNIDFLRALRAALSADDGTVFRWSQHENTVLLHLRRELLESTAPPADTQGLVDFIDLLTIRRLEGSEKAGHRAMVDLCKIAERFYFDPSTRGSSSLKKVLPALMATSARLRSLYGEPLYGTPAMPSLNLNEGFVWWRERDGRVCDPYDLLPPVFAGFDRQEQAALDAALSSSLQEGGTAMAAYARLQTVGLADAERRAIESALLRYCELDTLAMAMALQAWLAA